MQTPTPSSAATEVTISVREEADCAKVEIRSNGVLWIAFPPSRREAAEHIVTAVLVELGWDDMVPRFQEPVEV